MALDVRENIYPNGDKFYSVYAGEMRIGSYMRKDGGFLPQGCRKVLKNEKEAQVKVIQRYIAARLGEAARAAELYKEFELGDLV